MEDHEENKNHRHQQHEDTMEPIIEQALATPPSIFGNTMTIDDDDDKEEASCNDKLRTSSSSTPTTTSAYEYESSSLTMVPPTTLPQSPSPSSSPSSSMLDEATFTAMAMMISSLHTTKMPPAWLRLVTSTSSSESLPQMKHDRWNNDYSDLQSIIQYQYYVIGYEKLVNEMKVLGFIMTMLGIGTTYSTMSLLGYLLEGMSGKLQINGFRLPLLVANFIQVISGIVCIVTGMICILSSSSTRLLLEGPNSIFHKWCKYLVVIVNLGPISLIISIIQLCLGTVEIDTTSLEVMEYDGETGNMIQHNETTTMMKIMDYHHDEEDAPSEEYEFIPSILNPTSTDIIVVVCMGILNLVSVCATLIGGLTVCGLQLCAYQAYQPHSRTKHYHVIRLGYYCIMVIIGALSQIVLGIYCWIQYGFGPYDNGNSAIHIATYIIQIPLIPILVGTCQLYFGLYGFNIAYRWKDDTRGGSDHDTLFTSDQQEQREGRLKTSRTAIETNEAANESNISTTTTFQYITVWTWLITFFLQFLFPPAYGQDHDFISNGATFASVYMGFFIMPVYLEYLVRTTPTTSNPQMYGLPSDAPSGRPDLLVKWFYGDTTNNNKKTKSVSNNSTTARSSTFFNRDANGSFASNSNGRSSYASSFHDEEQRG